MDRSSESEFSFAITRIAVAQVCQSVGYGAAQTSALDILSDIAARYLKAIGKSASDSANSCGRTQSNLFDIVIALEDLNSEQGYAGASSSPTAPNSLISSSLLKEIKKFVFCTDEIPFAQPLPRKSLPTLRRYGGHRTEKGNYYHGMNFGHVPRWLPDFPVIGGKEVELGQREEIFGWDSGGEKKKKMMESEVKRKEERKRNEKGFELPEKRRKVIFEMRVKGGMGEKMGGAVLGRGGIGKRVFCHNLVSGDDPVMVERDGKKKKVAKMR